MLSRSGWRRFLLAKQHVKRPYKQRDVIRNVVPQQSGLVSVADDSLEGIHIERTRVHLQQTRHLSRSLCQGT